ncbi:TBC1 domain family member 10B [Monodelphis domestica]|uniref:TBC1 domain family member 10B n=1 Tax=Monodelphis domestica TaxID=13616 RepID=UPI0024E216E0|nr:TBC1 domain family member 10B [Monodelphis domestica]
METGPAPLVAPPRRHGASVAPSPPPRGSRAGPVLVVAPGPPVTTATSSPVTLVAPGEARPAWMAAGPRSPIGIPGSRPPPPLASAGSPGPAGGPGPSGSTVVVLTLESVASASVSGQEPDPNPTRKGRTDSPETTGIPRTEPGPGSDSEPHGRLVAPGMVAAVGTALPISAVTLGMVIDSAVAKPEAAVATSAHLETAPIGDSLVTSSMGLTASEMASTLDPGTGLADLVLSGAPVSVTAESSTLVPVITTSGAVTAKPPVAPKPGTVVASGTTGPATIVTAELTTDGLVATGTVAMGETVVAVAGPAVAVPMGTRTESPVVCETPVAMVTVTPAPEPTEGSQDLGSMSSLGPGIQGPRGQAPDSLSYLDSVSLMSGTLESLADDVSSMGSDSEINGLALRKTDKYGFLGGSQYSGSLESSVPVDVARQRELKWLDMFSNWDKWLSRRFQKVKLRCRKGIPSSLRAKAWQFLSNSKELLDQNPGKFEELERAPGDPKWLDVIEKDLHRQFPFHEMFAARGGHGQQDLYRILKAYTIYRPDEGYCQAQAPVAAVLLMHMPAEQAFWCLVQICDKYLPGYYSAGLEAIQLDGEIFFALLRRASPLAHRHLRRQRIDPVLYMTEWFMCIFARTLPWASVLRVWDMFFCEGVKIIFRVALVLLRHTLGSVEKLRSCQGMYETMEQLRNLPQQCMQEEFLVHEVTNLPVTEALIERENAAQLKKWRETRGELQYRPSRRLHGSRAIHEERRRQQPPLGPSSSLLSLPGLKSRTSRGGGSSSPPLPIRRASAGPAPGPVVTAEGLHPSLPSPTGNSTPLGQVKETKRQEKERQKQEKELQKQEKERQKQEKERQKQEKEREKERQKQEKKAQGRKMSLRRKADGSPPPQDGGDGTSATGARQDAYF